MQQSPRFAPFGSWKAPPASSMLFAPFRGLGPNGPFAPLAPPSLSKENIWGNNAAGFALLMKRNIAPEMPRHPKYRYYYGTRVVPLPQIGLGGLLHTLRGNSNTTKWPPPPRDPVKSEDEEGISPQSLLSSLNIDEDSASDPPLELETRTKRSTNLPWSHVTNSPDQRPSETFRSIIQSPTPRYAIPPIPKFLLEDDHVSHLPQTAEDELNITIGGPTGYLSWDHVAQTSHIFTFFQKRSQPASNTLSVDWHDCAVDQTGARGRTTLKLLFRYLNTPFPYQDPGSRHCPLSTLSKMSIKVPQVVKDLSSIDLLGQVTKEDDSIDLSTAASINEFSWRGDFSVFALKFFNVPLASLSVLSLTECLISVDDAVAVVHACPRLQTLTLEAIVPSEETDHENMVKQSAIKLIEFPQLTSLKVKCTDRHGLFINRMDLTGLKYLILLLNSKTVLDVRDFIHPTIPWSNLRDVTIAGNVHSYVYDVLEGLCQTPIKRFQDNGNSIV